MPYREVRIPVDDVHLDGLLHWEDEKTTRGALVLHPHPLYGGDMFNYVISSVIRAVLGSGYLAFRFNFRGTSRTRQHYDGIQGGLYDATSALEFIHAEKELKTFGVIGYSFGGSVAIALAARVPVGFLITVSASYRLLIDVKNTENLLPEIKCPVLMFHGERDKSVPFTDMDKISRLIGGDVVTCVNLPDVDHFYQKNLGIVHDSIVKFLRELS